MVAAFGESSPSSADNGRLQGNPDDSILGYSLICTKSCGVVRKESGALEKLICEQMAYFNLNIEKIKKIKRDSLFAVLKVIAILALAGTVAAIVLLQRQETRDKRQGIKDTRQETRDGLTDEEKIKILESLSAPADAPKYTNEEKRRILESLSAPSDRETLSIEEKKKILESLSAPVE